MMYLAARLKEFFGWVDYLLSGPPRPRPCEYRRTAARLDPYRLDRGHHARKH